MKVKMTNREQAALNKTEIRKASNRNGQLLSGKRRLRDSRFTSQPVLRFTPTAWAKLQFFCHQGESEIGGFGVTPKDDLLLIEEFVTVKQTTTEVSVDFLDEAVADFFEAQVDLGRKPEQFARLWLHTHPGDGPTPSMTDEETFNRVFGRCDWAVMFILARTGKTYNAESPYVSLDDWEGRPCYDCGYTTHEDDCFWCEGCDNDFCEECYSYCCSCDVSLCQGCPRARLPSCSRTSISGSLRFGCASIQRTMRTPHPGSRSALWNRIQRPLIRPSHIPMSADRRCAPARLHLPYGQHYETIGSAM